MSRPSLHTFAKTLLTLASLRPILNPHLLLEGLLRGDLAEVDGGVEQIAIVEDALASRAVVTKGLFVWSHGVEICGTRVLGTHVTWRENGTTRVIFPVVFAILAIVVAV